MADESLKYEAIELTGRLITSVDGTQLGKGDFQSLSNMRYTDKGIVSIKGNTKINASAIAKPTIGSAFHFVKDHPQSETHLLVQGMSAGTSAIYDSTDAIPNAATFTSLKTETANSEYGVFSPAPDGAFIYGNGNDLLIWGGNESRCSGFIVSDTDDVTATDTSVYDYTSSIVDSDSSTYALIKSRFVHIASTRALKGVKFYVGTANTATYAPTFTATSCVRSTNVVTVTKTNHGLLTGDLVTIAGATPSSFNATDVAITRTGANTFTYANTGPDESTSVQPTIALKIVLGVKYWNSSGAWAAVSSLTDGTSSGGKTLAQTGEISFTSTVGSAQLRYYKGILAYWYLFDFCNLDTTTSVYACTVDAPMQPITDIWDGVPRTVASFQIFYFGRFFIDTYHDFTKNIISTDYVSGAPETYCVMSTYNSSDYYVIGSTERLRGFIVNVVPSSINVTASTMTVQYWNGSSWVSLGIVDGTSKSGIPLSQTGEVYWTPPASSSEFPQQISNPLMLYYYKVSFSSTVSSGSWVDSIFGIPASSTIETYRFPTMFQNRPVLCNNQSSDSNSILIGAPNSNCVFNGDDTTKLFFGDDREVTCAVPFFSRFSNAFFENLIVGKPNSSWIVDGFKTGDYRTYQISGQYGVSAPKTMKACDLGVSGKAGGNAVRNVVIWQSSDSIVMWEGSIVLPIDEDIKDVFDYTNANSIEPTMIDSSVSFYDEAKREYHWLWASKGNSSLNKEYVYDIVRNKWYTVDRGTGKRLQLGINVIDNYNKRYVYGATTDGYLERLEYGQTFDGNSIVSSFRTGDIPLGGWMNTTQIRKIKPIFKSKNTTTNNISLSYYADTSNTATKTISFSVADTSRRISRGTKPVESASPQDAIFHSFEGSMTTNNENICFEPIGIGIYYKSIREDLK